MSRPFVLGLTGSIGMGKSAVTAMFRDLGVPVFDADACVRSLQGPGGVLIPAIEAAFPGTTGPDGVDRARLGAAVFGQPQALAELEAIVHPAVAERRAQFLCDHAAEPLVVYDIPLLFERTGRAGIDAVAVVTARADQQRERVMARPGMSVEKFEAILAGQMPDAEKRALADHIIDTSTPLEATRTAVSALVKSLTGGNK